MGDKWYATTLGEFVTLQRGHDLTDAERRLGKVPVMGAAGQNGFHDKAMAKGPGIIVGRSGASFGQVHYCETDFWPHNTGLYVTDFRGNNPRFAFYFLKALDFSRYNSGSAQPSLNRNFIYPIEVQIPPLPEQRAIAHILGTLDDKIELNRRMNETLEAMARALFKSWFIDFDPVRRNMARKTGQNQPSPPAPLPKGEGGKTNYRGGYDFSGLLETARALRHKQTPAEDLFWELVRDRRFLGLKFRRQHQLGDSIADYYCHEHRLVIELDDGIHSTTRKKDHKRDAWMESQGFKVLRFTNNQVLDDPKSVLTTLADAMDSAPSSHPSPAERRARDEGSAESSSPPLPLGEGRSEAVGEASAPPLPLGEGWGEGVGEGSAFDHLFPDSFEDSELGEIPKGWGLATLGEVAKNVSITFDFTRSNEAIFINTGDVLEGDFLHANRSSYVGLPGQAKKSIKSDDILFSEIRPANKRFAYVDFDASDYVASTKFMIIRASKIILPRLLYRILTTNETVNEFQVQAESRSGTFPQITFDSINYLPIVLPTMEIQQAFQRTTSDIDARIKLNKQQTQILAGLRDTLLPKLISGEMRVTKELANLCQ